MQALCSRPPSSSSPPASCLEELRLGATGLGAGGAATLFDGLAAAMVVPAEPEQQDDAGVLPVTARRTVGPLDSLK